MGRTTQAFPAGTNFQSPGWIAPNGRFFACTWYEHDIRAEELARKYYPDETKRKSGTQIFEEKHWVRLMHNGSFHVGADLQAPPRITQDQRDTLFDLITLNPENDFSQRLLIWLNSAEDR